ncbi:MAG: PAS domain S-box protein [Bacteroidetes bacterium]|nr:PAS domain S-box protein [Bacteroidota bacterium]
MNDLEQILNLHSEGAPWQNFLNAMLAFNNTRVKDEITADLYSHGLEVYLHFPTSKLASLFLLNTEGFLFHHSFSIPGDSVESVKDDFNHLSELGAIASALQSGSIIPWHLSLENKKDKEYLIIPLIDSKGVLGLILLELESISHEYEQLILGLCSFHSHQFTALINNAKLIKELKNSQSILEQRISFRTEDLKKSKRELQLILDSIHTGVFLIDPKSDEIIDVNLAALDLLKMTREMVVNHRRARLNFFPDQSESFFDFTELIKNRESTLRNLDGQEVPVIRTISKINFGDQLYLLESFIDISERKSAVKALVQSESRFRTIFEKAGMGMVITDLRGRILETNNSFVKMIGYDTEDLLNSSFNEYLSDKTKDFAKDVTDPKKKPYFENKIKCENGKLLWVRITSTFINDSKEMPLFRLEMVEDISYTKNHEEVLERQTNLLNGVADATTELLTELNFESAIRNALRIIGQASEVDRTYLYTFKDLGEVVELTRCYGWMKDPRDSSSHLNENFQFQLNKNDSTWFQIFQENGTICGLTKNVPKPERRVLETFNTESFLVVPIYVKEKPWGFIGFDDCYFERIWSENEESILKATAVAVGGAILRNDSQLELLESKDKAEKAFRLKSEFLAQMSHEIRTPINSILNFSGIIKEEFANKIDDELKTGLKIIDKAGKRIIRTMDMILNMSDIQTGHYDYSSAPINLFSDVLEKQYLEFIKHARDKNLEFKLLRPECSTDLECDEYTINQVFNNVIDNAIKYTMKGFVEVSVNKNEMDNLVVIIKDSGIGISEEYLPKLFEPFTQEEQGYSRKFEGNGLGMALVKKYCDLNKATIDINSKKGVGTQLSITFLRQKNA